MTVMHLAEVLLPGGDGFPSASETGMSELLSSRLASVAQRLQAAITAAGGPLGPLSPEQRHAVVARIEADEPLLFDELRKIVYLTYYEQEKVVAAIRALDLPYNAAPLPEGYAPEAFDATIDAPKHGRGRWKPT